jgi:hypothetical protein
VGLRTADTHFVRYFFRDGLNLIKGNQTTSVSLIGLLWLIENIAISAQWNANMNSGLKHTADLPGQRAFKLNPKHRCKHAFAIQITLNVVKWLTNEPCQKLGIEHSREYRIG